MSKASEILEGIKKLVFDKVQKFEEKKLQDGSPIMVSSLEVGGDVTINGASAPTGAYVLEDGTALNVDESGKITEIKEAIADDSVQMESHPLADGSSIDVSALEVGGDVKIGDAPAPAGTYSLADGRSIVVGEDGKISEVKEKAVEQVQESEGLAKEFASLKEEFTNSSQAFASYRDVAELRFSKAEGMLNKQAGIIEQMLSLVEELTKAPQTDPPSTGRKVNSFSKVETKNEKLNSYAEAARKLSEENK